MKDENFNKTAIFISLDIICIVFSFFLSYYIRHKNVLIFANKVYIEMFFVLIFIDILLSWFMDIYKNVITRNKYEEFRKTFIFSFMSLVLAVAYLFAVKESSNYSRVTMFLTYSIYLIITYISRLVLKRYIRKKAKKSVVNGNKSLLVICNYKDAKKVVSSIYHNNYNYYYLCGICIIDKCTIGEKISSSTVVANIDSLLNYVSTNWVDEILIATDYKKIPTNVIDGLKTTGITLHAKVNEITIFDDKQQHINNICGYNVVTATNIEYIKSDIIFKKIVDLIGGLVGCLITLILIIVIGPIIYIKSPGNIFYVSKRVGKNGKIFNFYKFRSMVLNADDLKDELKKDNIVSSGMMFKVENDPRIIPGIGNFIRKTSIDEFPQFLNVIKGDMSLVGTRPPTLDEWNKYDPYFRSRLSIKPGITGLWQVSGRSNITDFNEVVKLDNEYINNWSLSLDFKILAITVKKIFSKNSDAM